MTSRAKRPRILERPRPAVGGDGTDVPAALPVRHPAGRLPEVAARAQEVPMPGDGLSDGRRLGRVEVRQLIEQVLSGGGCVLYERGDGTFAVGTPAQDGSWRTVALTYPDGATRTTFTRAELLDYLQERSTRETRLGLGLQAWRRMGLDQA